MFNLDYTEIRGIDDFSPGICEVKAYYNGQTIGFISFYAIADMSDEIVEVNPHVAHVEPEYRHLGVGTKIISAVHDNYSVRFINGVNNTCEDKNDIHYTSEGLNFMMHCCRLGLATSDYENEVDILLNDEEFP